MNQVDKSRVPMYAFVFFAFLMSAVPGEAHLNSTGMGPFYDGLMHFLMSPEDIIPVLALALLAGLRGADFGRRALLVLPSAWLLGSLFGLAAAAKGNARVSAIWFVLLGGLLAANAKLSLGANHRPGCAARTVPRVFERNRNDAVCVCCSCSFGAGVRDLYSGRARRRICGAVTCAVGTNCGARCGKLDCGQRFSDARLGSSDALACFTRPTDHIEDDSMTFRIRRTDLWYKVGVP